jgi:hypothetical protein
MKPICAAGSALHTDIINADIPYVYNPTNKYVERFHHDIYVDDIIYETYMKSVSDPDHPLNIMALANCDDGHENYYVGLLKLIKKMFT